MGQLEDYSEFSCSEKYVEPWYSQRAIAHMFGTSIQNVSKHLKKLPKADYFVSKVRRPYRGKVSLLPIRFYDLESVARLSLKINTKKAKAYKKKNAWHDLNKWRKIKIADIDIVPVDYVNDRWNQSGIRKMLRAYKPKNIGRNYIILRENEE